MTPENLYRNIPQWMPTEITDQLAASANGSTRIERIVSDGQQSPPGFWYDQDQTEWVLLLQGEATLRFEADNQLQTLHPGDHLTIAAHTRHRIEATSDSSPTIWLAVFFDAG